MATVREIMRRAAVVCGLTPEHADRIIAHTDLNHPASIPATFERVPPEMEVLLFQSFVAMMKDPERSMAALEPVMKQREEEQQKLNESN